MIDFHSHVLPGIDDGSSSVEESLALLSMEAEQGIRHVVATPHFYAQHDRPEAFLARRAEALARLQAAMADRPELPELHVGAEVHYFRGISNSDKIMELRIGKSQCILVEMPHGSWTEEMYRELRAIWENFGVTPVIAHVDRYISPWHTHGIPGKLEQLPVLVQANASFFIDRKTRSMALKMLRRGQIHLLGSDCHDLKHRPPQLGQAAQIIESALGQKTLTEIVERSEKLLTAEAQGELFNW